MPNFDLLLGHAIADVRRRGGLSQEALASRAKLHPTYISQLELASRAKLHPTYISQLERGLKSPTVRVLFALAHACGLPASEILRQTEELAEQEK